VPGVEVPEEILHRMAEADARGAEVAREEGVRIALETIEALGSRVRGIHLYTVRGGLELALRVAHELRIRRGRA
jgi:methionine synthase / methylenetetrahydrofolate reductase(NADPH)